MHFCPFPSPRTKLYLKPSDIYMSKTSKQRRSPCHHRVPPYSLFKFSIWAWALLFYFFFLPGWQVHCVSLFARVFVLPFTCIHIENLLSWLVFFCSNHPEIKDNANVLPGRCWANSQLAGHQFGRLPSSVLPGGKWCFIRGLVQPQMKFSFIWFLYLI